MRGHGPGKARRSVWTPDECTCHPGRRRRCRERPRRGASLDRWSRSALAKAKVRGLQQHHASCGVGLRGSGSRRMGTVPAGHSTKHWPLSETRKALRRRAAPSGNSSLLKPGATAVSMSRGGRSSGGGAGGAASFFLPLAGGSSGTGVGLLAATDSNVAARLTVLKGRGSSSPTLVAKSTSIAAKADSVAPCLSSTPSFAPGRTCISRGFSSTTDLPFFPFLSSSLGGSGVLPGGGASISHGPGSTRGW
mmetsp:Transcript_100215/g.287908  ORF Transcript_100215/g.287908 Transcript_100215/m.287908 type:complete len:249 (-) Transcript_100215:1447-2193(-)